jgi:cytochrome c oxidase subunit 2
MPSPRSGPGPLRPTPLILPAGALLAGCAEGQNVLNPHGAGAREIAGLWSVVFWMGVGVFVVVAGILVYAVIRFRERPAAGLPTQVQGNTPLEVSWTIVPSLVLVALAVATLATMRVVAAPSPNALQINVIGHQWWWEFQYPAQKVATADELHVPAGQPVTIHVMAADVVHDFWMPELDRKLQAIPGHDNLLALTAITPGTYNGFCAEFCGLEHALMRFQVVVQTPADFAAWLQGQQAPPAPPATAQAWSSWPSRTTAWGFRPDIFHASSTNTSVSRVPKRRLFAGWDSGSPSYGPWLRPMGEQWRSKACRGKVPGSESSCRSETRTFSQFSK